MCEHQRGKPLSQFNSVDSCNRFTTNVISVHKVIQFKFARKNVENQNIFSKVFFSQFLSLISKCLSFFKPISDCSSSAMSFFKIENFRVYFF